MIKTNLTAFKAKVYWDHGDNGFYLADYEGDVYSDTYGLWLKHPRGYTKIQKEDLVVS